jgi:uncharacterized lipoprotein
MSVFFKSILLAMLLVACGGKDSRYRDTQMLEHPPALAVSKPAGELRVTDNSKVPKRREKSGLGADVYLTTSTPPQLKIRQPLDDAWSTLGLAIKQSKIEITDREHDKGLYYVLYDPEKSLFSRKNNEAVYVITLESDGAESTITATLGNTAEQSSAGGRGKNRSAVKDNSATQLADGAEKLVKSLYETMQNDLKEE